MMLQICHANITPHVGHNRHSGVHPSGQEDQEAYEAQQHSCSTSSCSNSSRMEDSSDPRSGRAEWSCRCCILANLGSFCIMTELCALHTVYALYVMLGHAACLNAQSHSEVLFLRSHQWDKPWQPAVIPAIPSVRW